MKRYYTPPVNPIDLPGCQTPQEARNFLASRGWYATGSDEFQKNGGDPMTWEQAIAIEFMNFITLGGPSRG